MRLRAGAVAVAASLLAVHCGGESNVTSSKRTLAGAGSGIGGGGAGFCNHCAGGGGRLALGGGGGRLQFAGAAGASHGGQPPAGGGGLSAASGAPEAGGETGAGQAGEDTVGSAGDGAAGAAGESTTLLPGVAISKVAIYQAIELPLLVAGQERPPNENAPLIAARDALLRVWVTPNAAWGSAALTAEATIDDGTNAPRSVSLTKTSAPHSTDKVLSSTLNFSIRASELGAATSVSVVVRDGARQNELAHWPASGARALAPRSSNGAFLVTLVPLVASGFVPDTGEANRARFEHYLSEIYPASAVDVTVRAPVTLSSAVEPDGTGWDEALDQLYATRDADEPPDNVYYYGVLTPGATFDSYCGGSCVVGLSNVAAPTQTQYRGGIGTGYFTTTKDTFSEETMAHELGHALGREHSPCGTDDAEPAFPYVDGNIGVLGYDGTRLLDPVLTKDVMGYCVPVWISDYTFSGLFARIAYVNGAGARIVSATGPAREAQRSLLVGIDGRLRWGHEARHRPPADGEAATVELIDANGRVLRSLDVPFSRLDHLPGGTLSVPSSVLADRDVAAVRVSGRTLPVR